MITKKRVVLLLSTLLVLSGCVFSNKEDKNIVLQIAASEENPEIKLKDSNYTQEYETVNEPIVGTKLNQVVYKEASNASGVPWLASKVQDAEDAKQELKLIHTYNQFKEKISTISVPGSKVLTDATATIYEYGSTAKVGAEWKPSRVTRYGYDCAGCSVTDEDFSGTASGIKVSGNSVRQANGTWQSGLTYHGLHIIATSSAIPLCTTVKISNHPFSGGGISPGVPFYAIVGDRGVSNGNIDLFIGSESDMSVSQRGNPSRSNTKVEIVGFNGRINNSAGKGCGY